MTTSALYFLLTLEFAIFEAVIISLLVWSRRIAASPSSGIGLAVVFGVAFLLSMGFIVDDALTNPNGSRPAGGILVVFAIVFPIVFLMLCVLRFQSLRKRGSVERPDTPSAEESDTLVPGRQEFP